MHKGRTPARLSGPGFGRTLPEAELIRHQHDIVNRRRILLPLARSTNITRRDSGLSSPVRRRRTGITRCCVPRPLLHCREPATVESDYHLSLQLRIAWALLEGLDLLGL